MKNEIMKALGGMLNNPGDIFEARVTKSGNKVAKFSSGDGLFKASKTVYSNGTVHETRTYKV
ncbi:hypothetical protein [Lachnospira pectinoschiza]|uniref:Uncharacterized protein n=1 Tax=Lachnospira pectinoschiza TaxID=28052 RepID=A0A1G9UFM1_9FIRM|nr:hypothetical protein [Lachnospira pectinoschiza]SDM58709.1 hypothetical protein SAMN05216544_0745 [Lachnospira pectinoschiza]